MNRENDNLDAPQIPIFERVGHQHELPDFELEEGQTAYVDLSDEYFETLDACELDRL